MRTAAALLYLHRAGFAFRADAGRLLCKPPALPPSDAEAARGVLRDRSEEAAALLAWPWVSIAAVARFGHADALLYPFIGAEVSTAAGPAVLRQVLGGWAVVQREGAERPERLRASDVLPPAAEGVPGRAG